MPGEIVIGNWQFTQADDFPNGIAGDLGWTSAVAGAGAANTALSANLALNLRLAAIALGAGNAAAGGVVATVGSTAAGVTALELTNMVIPVQAQSATALGLGIEIDFRMYFDTLFSNPTNTFRVLMGLFDSVGAVTTGNFIGVEYTGTAGVGQDFRIAYGTVAAPTYVDSGIAAVTLDKAYNVRFVLYPNGQNALMYVNGVNMNPIAAQGLLTVSGVPITTAMTAGWIGFKNIATVGTTGTALTVLDAVSYSVFGRTQNS